MQSNFNKKSLRQRDKSSDNMNHEGKKKNTSKKHQGSKKKNKERDSSSKIVLNTTQDIEKLEQEMMNEISKRNDTFNKMEESFEQKKLQQLTQAERILQDSRREASSRERFFT